MRHNYETLYNLHRITYLDQGKRKLGEGIVPISPLKKKSIPHHVEEWKKIKDIHEEPVDLTKSLCIKGYIVQVPVDEDEDKKAYTMYIQDETGIIQVTIWGDLINDAKKIVANASNEKAPFVLIKNAKVKAVDSVQSLGVCYINLSGKSIQIGEGHAEEMSTNNAVALPSSTMTRFDSMTSISKLPAVVHLQGQGKLNLSQLQAHNLHKAHNKNRLFHSTV